MTTKTPNLNISAFLHPSPWGLETPRQTRLHCVLVVLLHCTHTFKCILTVVFLHLCTYSCMSTLRSSCSPYTWDHDENHSENLSSWTYLQDPPSGVHYSPWAWVALQLQLHINPGFHVETLGGNVYGSQSEGPQNSNFVVPRMWFHITLLNSFVLIFMEPRLCLG